MSLEFSLNQSAPAAATVDCIVVGAHCRWQPDAGRHRDRCRQRRQGCKALVARGDVSGKTGKTALLHDLPGVAAPRVLVVGLGDAGKFGVPQYLKAVGDAAARAEAARCSPPC